MSSTDFIIVHSCICCIKTLVAWLKTYLQRSLEVSDWSQCRAAENCERQPGARLTEHEHTLNFLTTQHWHEGRFHLQMNEGVSVHKHTEVQACSRHQCLESLAKTGSPAGFHAG